MKTLSLEQMERVEGGGCPWYLGEAVGLVYGYVGLLVGGGPAGWIIGAGAFVSAVVISYACSRR